jgi:nitrite reductase (cytochrome c-552)
MRVETIQERTSSLRDIALNGLVELIDDLKSARDAGASAEELLEAQKYHRQASFFLDFVEAENSAGFHADQESVRVLGNAIDCVRKGQSALHKAQSMK